MNKWSETTFCWARCWVGLIYVPQSPFTSGPRPGVQCSENSKRKYSTLFRILLEMLQNIDAFCCLLAGKVVTERPSHVTPSIQTFGYKALSLSSLRRLELEISFLPIYPKHYNNILTYLSLKNTESKINHSKFFIFLAALPTCSIEFRHRHQHMERNTKHVF